MDLEEVFADARTKDTYNKFWIKCGIVTGMGIDDYGHKRCTVFIKRIVLNKAPNEGGIIEDAKSAYGTRPMYLIIALNESRQHDLIVGDIVEVEGHTVSYTYYNKVNGKTGHVFYLKEDKITKVFPSITRIFGPEAEGSTYERAVCRTCYKGYVVSHYKRRDSIWHKLALKVDSVDNDERKENIIILQYTENMRVNDVKPRIGDKIAVVGSFYSNNKQIGHDSKKLKFYIDIIPDDIAIIERNDNTKTITVDGTASLSLIDG